MDGGKSGGFWEEEVENQRKDQEIKQQKPKQTREKPRKTREKPRKTREKQRNKNQRKTSLSVYKVTNLNEMVASPSNNTL